MEDKNYVLTDKVAGEIIEGDFDAIHLELQDRLQNYGVKTVMKVIDDTHYEIVEERYDKMQHNFGDLLKYIRNEILEPETEELEADDLTFTMYENEICFQINEIYDGLMFIYNKEKDALTMEIPLDRRDSQELGENEVIQAGKMMEVLNVNKFLLKDLLN